MEELKSPLEIIFEAICHNYGLSIEHQNQKKIARGSVYFLELERQKEWTRLLYGDRVATADFYDCKEQKYLNYTLLSIYQEGQNLFLRDNNSNIAKRLLEKLTPEKTPTHRRTINISLGDFSEVETFLETHLENY